MRRPGTATSVPGGKLRCGDAAEGSYCQMLWMEFLAAASFTVTGRAAAEPLRGGLRSFHPPSLRSQIGGEACPRGTCQACLPSGFGWGVMKSKRLRRRRLHFAFPAGCKRMPVQAAISSLKTIVRQAVRLPLPLVRTVRSRTVANVDSIGLVVRRWIQCSAGKS
jgi:hypothetical protein